MYHPLLDSLADLKDSDIDAKITELIKKHNIASRSGNSCLCEQICAILSMYREEQSRRHSLAAKRIANAKNSDLDDLINVE